MRSMRIISDNAADRATLVVQDTVGGMGAQNLKTDIKGQVCRVLGNTASITCSWTDLETVGGVVIPASNLGPSSTIRVRAYSDSAGLTLIADTGDKWAAPGPIFENEDFTQPLNVNSFAFGFPPITAVYFTQQEAVRRIQIDIYDPAASFIDLSRLITGRYFSPLYNASYGQVNTIIDLSVNSRAASGDLKTELGPKSKVMTFDLADVRDSDRAQVQQLMQKGIGRWMFISLCPEDVDAEKERDKSIYGKPSTPSSMSWASFGNHTANYEIEGF